MINYDEVHFVIKEDKKFKIVSSTENVEEVFRENPDAVFFHDIDLATAWRNYKNKT